MKLRTTVSSREALRELPTRARPVIDARDVMAPEGYAMEAVVAGLSFPCDLAFAEYGTIFISEGGST